MITLPQHLSGRRLRLAWATAAVVVLGVLTATPVTAQRAASPVNGGIDLSVPGSMVANPDTRDRGAPTPTLAKVASALTAKSKSVSMLVKLPAGLNLNVPVKVSLLVDGVWSIQDYVNSTGNRWFYNLNDEDAQVRRQSVTVALHEIAPGGQSHTFTLRVRIEPLYDISIGGLTFTLLSDADWFGTSECIIEWSTPEGEFEEHKLSIHGGDSHRFDSFARHYSEVSVAAGLLMSVMRWTEADTSFGVSFNPRVAPSEPILRGRSVNRIVTFVMADEGDGYNGSDASARFSYSLIITLRTYHPSQL